jgi:hypothetical protein
LGRRVDADSGLAPCGWGKTEHQKQSGYFSHGDTAVALNDHPLLCTNAAAGPAVQKDCAGKGPAELATNPK